MERRLRDSDYHLVKAVLGRVVDRMKRHNTKPWFKYIVLEDALKFFFEHDNAWIVDDAYLVVYNEFAPFYNESIKFIEEVIVLRLVRGHDFSSVTSFLERRRVEAGAVEVLVGTALSRTDEALASLYEKQGYHRSCITLMSAGNVHSG